MDNISQSCLIPWRAGKCLEAALWTLRQREKQMHCHLSTRKFLRLSLLSRGTQIPGSVVSWLFLRLADFGTRSLYIVRCTNDGACGWTWFAWCSTVPSSITFPGRDGEVLLWLFLYSAYLLHPQRYSLPELTMCRSYFHSSVEFKDTSFPLTPVLLNYWKYPSAGLSNADNTHSGMELVTGCLCSALPNSEFLWSQQCASVSFSAFWSLACQIG